MQNEAYIFNFLEAHGFTRAANCGIMGNIQIESDGSPTAYNPGEDAIGLCQWEGGRRTDLQQFAAGMGKPETDLDAQLNFLIYEAKQRGNFDGVNAVSDPGEAAAYWDAKFEVSAGTARQARIDAAVNYFNNTSYDASPPPPAPAPSPGQGNSYTVREGDTLSGIAANFGLADWHTLWNANRQAIGDNPDLIHPGLVLAIPDSIIPSTPPAAAPAPPLTHPEIISYTVQPGDTLSGIAARYGVDWHELAAINALANPDLIYPGQAIMIRGGSQPRSYTVQEGDTLSGIGQALGIDWPSLYERNRAVIGDNPDLIHPGQVLVY